MCHLDIVQCHGWFKTENSQAYLSYLVIDHKQPNVLREFSLLLLIYEHDLNETST